MQKGDRKTFNKTNEIEEDSFWCMKQQTIYYESESGTRITGAKWEAFNEPTTHLCTL